MRSIFFALAVLASVVAITTIRMALPRDAPAAAVQQAPDAQSTRIDRHDFLAGLYEGITAPHATEEQRVKAVVTWAQARLPHAKVPPLLSNGQALYDPIDQLREGTVHCGQVNRFVVDVLTAGGHRAAVVQMRNHVGAGVYLDGAWRYIDASALRDGDHILNDAGALATFAEILADPHLIAGHYMRSYDGQPVQGIETSLHHVFNPWRDPTSGLVTPFRYIKTATREQERNEYFGWNYYKAAPLLDPLTKASD